MGTQTNQLQFLPIGCKTIDEEQVRFQVALPEFQSFFPTPPVTLPFATQLMISIGYRQLSIILKQFQNSFQQTIKIFFMVRIGLAAFEIVFESLCMPSRPHSGWPSGRKWNCVFHPCRRQVQPSLSGYPCLAPWPGDQGLSWPEEGMLWFAASCLWYLLRALKPPNMLNSTSVGIWVGLIKEKLLHSTTDCFVPAVLNHTCKRTSPSRTNGSGCQCFKCLNHTQ